MNYKNSMPFPNVPRLNNSRTGSIGKPHNTKIDHTTTFIMIIFVIVLFSSIQFFAQSLNGKYTIDASGSGRNNFTTISDAVNSLYTNGISGSVTFEIIGTFDEQIDLNGAISGSSKFNQVTFQASSLGNGGIVYTPNIPINNFIVRINDAQYINFNNLEFSYNYQSGDEGNIIYSDTPKGNVTFENNSFAGITGTVSGSYKNAIIKITANNSSENLNNTSFTNNTFIDGTNGISLESDFSNPSINILISNNIFQTEEKAISLIQLSAPKVLTNTITNSFNDYAISLVGCRDDFVIEKNNIVSTNDQSSGIEIYNHPFSSSRGEIVNNFIQANQNGIFLDVANNVDVYFNSININDVANTPNSASAAIKIKTSCIDLNIQNNIFVNKREGYAFDAENSDGPEITISDYNCFYTNGTYLTRWNNSQSDNLANYIIANGFIFDLNSKETDPNFSSITDLHTNSSLLHKSGTQISAVTTDIDNDLRVSATPCIGADEYYLPLAGTYTIGNNADYSTISDAVSDLYLSTINGPVIFKIKDGQFNEQINLDGAITGSSSSNTVTFESNSGFHGNVNIVYTAGSSSSNYVLRINEAQYLKFQNLTFTAGGTTYAKVVSLENVLGDLEFYDNVMNGYQISSGTGTTEQDIIYCYDGILHNSIFEGNDINNGNKGINLLLNSSPKSSNLQIINNTISTYSSTIDLTSADTPIIESNILENAIENNIDLGFCSYFILEKNLISGSNGIYVTNSSGTSLKYSSIMNNIINVSQNGIKTQYINYVNIFFNTIVNTASSVSQYSPIIISYTYIENQILNIFNNILYASGGAVVIDSRAGAIAECNYNNLYTTGPTLVEYDNTDYSTLSDWQSAPEGFDQNSYSSSLTFISESDLHILNSSELLFGISLSEVTDDIDGDSRNDPPFIGADEPNLDISELSLNIMLEGPFNTASNKMNSTLTIPNTSPYSEHYKNVSSIPNGAVDWVLVKLLDDQYNLVIAQSAFLIGDGTIISADGSSTLKFLVDKTSDYYVVIEHRNHLSVMSSSTVSFN